MRDVKWLSIGFISPIRNCTRVKGKGRSYRGERLDHGVNDVHIDIHPMSKAGMESFGYCVLSTRLLTRDK